MKNLRQFVGVPTECYLNDRDLLRAAHALICKDLDMKSGPRLNVQPFSLYGSNYCSMSNQVNLCESDYLTFHPLFILAHECRHAFQVETSLLGHSFKTMSFLWKGESFCMLESRKVKHEHLPWEQDANRYANEIMRQLEIDYRRET